MLHMHGWLTLGMSSKKSKCDFVPMVHTRNLEVMPMVKNKVKEGRCQSILYGYLNYLAKDGKYCNAVQCKDNFPMHSARKFV